MNTRLPNKSGNWTWYDEKQMRHIVDIVLDNGLPKVLHKGKRIDLSEWPSRWGDRLGERGTISDILLFDGEPN